MLPVPDLRPTGRPSAYTPGVRPLVLFLSLLGAVWCWPGWGVAGSPDWGAGFFRLNPAQDPAFVPEKNREEDRWRSDRNSRSQTEPFPEENTRRRSPPPREWSEDRDATERRGRYDNRPWGEVPPEWRNEDLDRRLPREGYANGRRSSRSYDAPEEGTWSAPEGDLRGERNSWEYPYSPDRDYRRRDSYPSPSYSYEDRFGSRSGRRRVPPYYYDGSDGWWDAP